MDAEVELDGLVPESWPPHTAVVAFDVLGRRRRLLDATSDVPFRSAVAASMAIPGIFKPVALDGRPYCDGGVLSRTNAALVLGCADNVIVVNTTGTTQWPDRRAPHLLHRRLASIRLTMETRHANAVIIEPELRMFTERAPSIEARMMETFVHGLEVALERLELPAMLNPFVVPLARTGGQAAGVAERSNVAATPA